MYELTFENQYFSEGDLDAQDAQMIEFNNFVLMQGKILRINI